MSRPIEDRVEHLQRLRDQQDKSGGFTAFICWTFQPEHTVLKVEHRDRRGGVSANAGACPHLSGQLPEYAKLVGDAGTGDRTVALKYGANDFGSVMMEENVVSSAGTTFRLNAAQIEALIRDAGYEPRRRNNWYELLN